MRVLVCGGREFDDAQFLFDVLNSIKGIQKIVHGGAYGADQLAGRWAVANNIPVEVFPADWRQYGKRAGYLRNVQMAESKPDLVIAFRGGKGTEMMVKIAKEKDIPVKVYV